MSEQKTPSMNERLTRLDEDRTPPASVPHGELTAPEREGPKGPEPTRFGDWEQKGRCTDF